MSGNAEQKSVVLGEPINRIDGKAKVCGQARYAAEVDIGSSPLIGWIVESTEALSTLADIDVADAEKCDGVRAVLTYKNTPPQAPFGSPDDAGRFEQSRAMLRDDTVRYVGIPVALVIANTLEQARYAASQVRVKYSNQSPAEFSVDKDRLDIPEELDGGLEPDVSTGDVDETFSHAQQTLDVCYTTPNQVSAAMEPHACVATFEKGQLTVYMSVQIIDSAVTALANTLQLDESNIRVISSFVGGGFGSKLGVHNEAVVASLAAMYTGQPVKVVQHRRNLFANAPHRGSSEQRIRLACDDEGRLTCIDHYSVMPVAKGYAFAEPTGAGARVTYASSAIRSRHRVSEVDMPIIDSTRAPGDAIGSLAFESAIDELARQVKQDPLAFRLLNMPDKHPVSGNRFSSFKLKDCLQQGAEKFGWSDRDYSSEASHIKVGYGVAAATRLNTIVETDIALSLHSNGTLQVCSDMTDIGTGTYTILAQVVADFFAVPIDAVTVSLGDSKYPASCGSGGSFGASSCASALHDACKNLKETLLKRAQVDSISDLRLECDNVHFIHSDKQRDTVTIASLLKEGEEQGLYVEGHTEPGEDHDTLAQFSTGAHFCMVNVNTLTGEVKVLRQFGIFSAGKILNHKTASSQLKGGMVWGAGYALLEEAVLDPRYGRFINRDLAEYHIPVNRDIADVTVEFIEVPDFKACPVGSKGIGELGIVGAGAAIANAITDACGARVRTFPITADKILFELGYS